MNQLTEVQAQEAITTMISMIQEEETVELLEECKAEAGADLNKIMELVLPKIFEIQGLVMQKYGFQPDDAGFDSFSLCLKANEVYPQVSMLASQFKSILNDLCTVEEDANMAN